jgi:hypothetical protein
MDEQTLIEMWHRRDGDQISAGRFTERATRNREEAPNFLSDGEADRLLEHDLENVFAATRTNERW